MVRASAWAPQRSLPWNLSDGPPQTRSGRTGPRTRVPRRLPARAQCSGRQRRPLRLPGPARCALPSYATGGSSNTHGACLPAKDVRWKETLRGLESRPNGILIDRCGAAENAGHPHAVQGPARRGRRRELLRAARAHQPQPPGAAARAAEDGRARHQHRRPPAQPRLRGPGHPGLARSHRPLPGQPAAPCAQDPLDVPAGPGGREPAAHARGLPPALDAKALRSPTHACAAARSSLAMHPFQPITRSLPRSRTRLRQAPPERAGRGGRPCAAVVARHANSARESHLDFSS